MKLHPCIEEIKPRVSRSLVQCWHCMPYPSQVKDILNAGKRFKLSCRQSLRTLLADNDYLFASKVVNEHHYDEKVDGHYLRQGDILGKNCSEGIATCYECLS